MKLERYRVKMNYLHPRTKLQKQQQRSLETEQRMRNAMERKLNVAKHQLAIRIEQMKGLSPLAKLNQGFSYVTAESGKVVKRVEHVNTNDSLKIYVTDGIVVLISVFVFGIEKTMYSLISIYLIGIIIDLVHMGGSSRRTGIPGIHTPYSAGSGTFSASSPSAES